MLKQSSGEIHQDTALPEGVLRGEVAPRREVLPGKELQLRPLEGGARSLQLEEDLPLRWWEGALHEGGMSASSHGLRSWKMRVRAD